MPNTISFPGSGALGINLLILVAVSGCDDDPPPRMQNPPPETDLVWDQGNWDELDWQYPRERSNMKRLMAVYLIIWIPSSVWAGQVDIPNQFQAGTAAVAADVNANFSAVETAVDDNAQQIDGNTQAIAGNAQAIGGLQAGLGTAGISVKPDGVHVGRFVAAGRPPIEMPVNGGTELLAAGAIGLGNSPQIDALSDTGYRFSIVTSAMTVGTRVLWRAS